MSHLFESIRIWHAEREAYVGRMLHTIADSGYREGSPWTIEQYQESVVQEHVHYFLAEVGEEAVGFVGAGVVGAEAEIQSIAVAEKAKQNGIGYRLLIHLIKWLKTEGVKELFLEVRKSNAPAIRLYTKTGFQLIGKRPRYYSHPTEDAYVMKLKLNEEV